MKRVKIKIDKPNPLFESWLEEWMNEAASKNSDLQHHFSKALRSLKKYPLPLKSGKDCIILQNFGVKLCSMLDRKLDEYKVQNNGLSSVGDESVCINCFYEEYRNTSRKRRSKESQTTVDLNSVRQTNEVFNEVQVQTQLHSQLTDTNEQDLILISNNEDHEDSVIQDFSENPSTKFQDQQNILADKPKLVDEHYMTKQPVETNKVNDNTTAKKTKPAKGRITKKQVNNEEQTANAQKDIYLESNSFDILLLVDTQETCGGKTRPQDDATIAELSQLGVLFEVRHLKVGDFAWIARCRNTNVELILPYIVERKRIDDLSASITDGRFHEQKFRLKQCGIENIMYIVENYDQNHRSAIPHSSLLQASINTLVQDRFTIKYTRSHKDSMFHLSSLTRIFKQVFMEKSLIGCKKEDLIHSDILSNTIALMEFELFNRSASKQKVFNVSQMFVRQLLQLKGVSVEKALAIVEHYPTPRILINALNKPGSDGKMLLSNIQFGEKKRSLGPTISNTIYQLYTKKDIN